MKNILFITWDGPDVSYLEGLFLSMFQGLSKKGYSVKILQLTWADKKAVNAIKNKLESIGVKYEAIIINRKLPLYISYPSAIIKATFKLKSLIKNNKYHYIMPRSIMPSFICLLCLNKRVDVKIIYDSDGFPHDERVDFGNWKVNGLAYQFYRYVEFKMFHRADWILTRSAQAKNIINARAGSGFNNSKIIVIWNGRDENILTILIEEQKSLFRKSLGISQNVYVVLYVGSLGEKYCVKEMLLFFEYVRTKRDAKVIILTKHKEYLNAYAKKLNLSITPFIVKEVQPEEVISYVNIADVGLFFCAKTFSTQAVFPTKLSEYLLAGLPVLISAGIGDCDTIAEKSNGVFLIDDYTNTEFEKVIQWLDKTRSNSSIRYENRNMALRYLTVEATVNKIIAIIEK